MGLLEVLLAAWFMCLGRFHELMDDLTVAGHDIAEENSRLERILVNSGLAADNNTLTANTLVDHLVISFQRKKKTEFELCHGGQMLVQQTKSAG